MARDSALGKLQKFSAPILIANRDAALDCSPSARADCCHGLARQPDPRSSLVRIVPFLLGVALVAAGAAWIAEQTGEVTLSWGGYSVVTSLPTFALALGVTIVGAMLVFSLLQAGQTKREPRMSNDIDV